METGLINGQYKVGRKLGKGAFGEIFEGIDTKTGEGVALKLEPAGKKKQHLEYEYLIYSKIQGFTGIPKVHWYGTEGEYNILAMELCGPPIEYLFRNRKDKFSLKTVLMITLQMLEILEFIHQKRYLHRDIKPENILIGKGPGKEEQIYLIDFGLAMRYIDPRTGEHVPYIMHKKLTGTVRYASINTHMGIEQGRRDDLESLGYVIIYHLRGSLPWQGVVCFSREEKHQKIKEKKMATSIESLCEGCPDEFAVYFKYCMKLRFNEEPDFVYLKTLFKNLFNRSGFKFDRIYDWVQKPKKPVIIMKKKPPEDKEEKKA